ncbi:MAG: PAS domain-containing sensor histidine kinase [Bacteroidetes bacterium]|nr:MAG: PAS domain-containing sensor histidine kinase [Bacteroidota bacterium]
MHIAFKEKLKFTELKNLRSLNVMAAIVVTLMGFIFEFAYHDGYILVSGLLVSIILTSNYFLSFYSLPYREHFTNITYASIFLLHFWAVYVTFSRDFEIDFLLPLSISIFTFSLIFDRFYKSLIFIFTITTILLFLMLTMGEWEPEHTIALITLYTGALISNRILQQKEAYHSEIQNQEMRYLDLVENMNDGLIYVNDKLEFQFLNDRFCEITGFNREDLLGRSMMELSKDEGAKDVIQQFFNDLKNSTSVEVESELIHKNKSSVWVQMKGSKYQSDDSSKAGFMLVFSDITKLKLAQQLLKHKEEGYRSFIEQSAVGIWRAEYKKPIPIDLPLDEQVDLLLDTGVIAECNDFMAMMYGYSSTDSLLGKRIREFYHVENNFDEERTKEFMTIFIKNDYRISSAESKELDRDGNIRYMLNNNIGVIENGYLLRTWGVQTDITERKKTERELIETNHELDTFFYKASHDLKGPLASVMGIVNLARLENQNNDLEGYFSMIETSVKRLDRTLLDLIELARTRRGNTKISVINMKGLVEEILGSLKHVPDFARINFELKIDQHTEVQADKVLILSVFQNLIHNAINYCNHESPWIRIKIQEKDKVVYTEISDNGKGIPENIKGRVFEMFYRGNQESSGSGLGLFIVKNALEKMKGKIRFESEIGKGTTFFVTLPSTVIES